MNNKSETKSVSAVSAPNDAVPPEKKPEPEQKPGEPANKPGEPEKKPDNAEKKPGQAAAEATHSMKFRMPFEHSRKDSSEKWKLSCAMSSILREMKL